MLFTLSRTGSTCYLQLRLLQNISACRSRPSPSSYSSSFSSFTTTRTPRTIDPSRHTNMTDDTTDSSCIFCQIASGQVKPGGKGTSPQRDGLLYETERLVAFRDASPASDFHILVVPKRHVRHCWDLPGPNDSSSSLMDEMEHVATALLNNYCDEATPDVLRFFSRPPLYTVPHVHLHVLTRPLTRWQWWNPLHAHYRVPALQVTPSQWREEWKQHQKRT